MPRNNGVKKPGEGVSTAAGPSSSADEELLVPKAFSLGAFFRGTDRFLGSLKSTSFVIATEKSSDAACV